MQALGARTIGSGGGGSSVFTRRRAKIDFTRTLGKVACTRATVGYAQRRDGSWQQFAANVARRTDVGLFCEGAAVSSVVAPDFAGYTVGGALPAGMSVTGLANGVTIAVVAQGVEDGLPYIDVRISGTASANTFPAIDLSNYNASVLAANGQDWVASCFLKRSAGSFPGSTELYTQFLGVNAAGVTQETAAPSLRVLPSNQVPLGSARHHHPWVLGNAASVGVRFRIFALVYSGTTIDVTLRIGWPQVERGTYPSSLINVSRATDRLTLALPRLGRAGRIACDYAFLRRTSTAASLRVLQFDNDTSGGADRHVISRATSGDMTVTSLRGGASQNSQTIAAGASARTQSLVYEYGISSFALGFEKDELTPQVGAGVPPMRCNRVIFGCDHLFGLTSDIVFRSIEISTPPATAELQVASNCACFSNLSTAVASGQIVREWRTRHRVGRVPAKRLAVWMGGFYVDGGTVQIGSEQPIGNDVATEIAIEIAGVNVLAGSAVVPNNSAMTKIGQVTPGQFGLSEFAEGMTFYVHGRETVSAGQFRGGGFNAAWTHGSCVAHDGSQNLLMTPGAKTASGGATQITSALPTPLYITGEFSEPEIAAVIIGNSIDQGSSDVSGDGESGGGFWLRGLWSAAGGPIASCNHARGSTSINQASQYSQLRQKGWKFFNTMLCGDVTNDLSIAGDSSTAVKTFWARMFFDILRNLFKQVVTRNTIPRTTSTDAWATVANQTPTANFETGGLDRDALNTWIAANAGELGVRAVIDVNAAVRDGTALDKWAVGNTGDGTHPNATGAAAMGTPVTTAVNALRPLL